MESQRNSIDSPSNRKANTSSEDGTDATAESPHQESIAVTALPRQRLPKKLVICCDGTWMNSDSGWVKGKWGGSGHLQNPSNVTRLARSIPSEDDNHHPQIVYYQAGVGTGIGLYDQLLGGGTGLGLSENIREAYAFLASNYAEHDQLIPDDSIFLIGFSRGAFTARSIGGLIGAVGVLRRQAMPHFYEIFKDWENAGNPDWQPQFFAKYFEENPDAASEKICNSLAKLANDNTKKDEYMDLYRDYLRAMHLTQIAKVKCIGVFDTVGALGIPINPKLQKIIPWLPSFIREYQWFDTSLGNHIENAFQALALDERRAPFSPSLWEKPNGCNSNLKQMWFPGTHSNIGGSYSDYGMADITLAWMMDQLAGHTVQSPKAFKSADWIKFDEEFIDHYYSLREKYYERHDTFRGWAMGKLYDSMTFPISILGSRVRHPGGYHKTFYETGDIDKSQPLKNTNEYIHMSTRVRMELGGRAVEADNTQIFTDGLSFRPILQRIFRFLTGKPHSRYQPEGKKGKGGPLEGWTLLDGNRSHARANLNGDIDVAGEMREARWRYEGRRGANNTGPKFIPEERLGYYEQRMWEKDKPIDHRLQRSEGGRYGLLRRVYRESHHGWTM